MSARFLQIHTLTPYHASLLNRDDAGFAKRIPFGGATRTRISSQCLKRHWRRHDGEHALAAIPGVEMSVRSRETFQHHLVQPLVKTRGVGEALAQALASKLQAIVLGQKEKADKKAKAGEDEADSGDEVATGTDSKQVTVLGQVELRYLLELAATIAAKPTVLAAAAAGGKDAGKKLAEEIGKHLDQKELKANLQALGRGAEGLDAAVFGRMVTSDVLSRTDAAIHVAHAFTVHGEDAESDYFSAMDDLLADTGALGSGHINSSELNTGLYYGYVVVDLRLLKANLQGVDQAGDLSAEVIRRLVHTIASVSPGAKKGATAPYSRAHLVLVEAGNAQPRSLANAWLKPVSKHADLQAAAYRNLGRHVADLDGMYQTGEARRFAAIGPVEELDFLRDTKAQSLADVATWAAAQVRG